MRTPLLLRLSVTISPWNSWPDFLKVPMFAMSFLLWLVEPATIAASMAICRPKAIDDAPVFGPKRSGGWRRGEFLVSREEWAKPRGRKSTRRRCVRGDRGAAALRLDHAIRGYMARAHRP